MCQGKITQHFNLSELTRSATAQRHGLANDPGPTEKANLIQLATHILEPVRQYFGLAFYPSSGFRSPVLNQLVGSKSTSQHITGQAVDFEIPTIANRDLANWIKVNLAFDQLILEFYHSDDPKSGWVHCSYRKDHNRNMCLIFDGSSYRKF